MSSCGPIISVWFVRDGLKHLMLQRLKYSEFQSLCGPSSQKVQHPTLPIMQLHNLLLDYGKRTNFKLHTPKIQKKRILVHIHTMSRYMMDILFNNIISGMYNTNRNSSGASLVWHREMLKSLNIHSSFPSHYRNHS